MTGLEVGSDRHRDLFCGEFVATHRAYGVEDLVWPDLDVAAVERLRALPFWSEAVHSERTAAARVQAMADEETDPVVQAAVALQAYEEARHAALLEAMLARYEIPSPGSRDEMPRDAEWGFLRMGYGECFDSFFAFGLFRVAAETGLFPAPLVGVFDRVMQEEARHILFFVNWAAHRQARLPVVRRPWFRVRRGVSVLWQVAERCATALRLRGGEARDDFTMQVPAAFGDMTLTRLASLCLRENEQRLAPYDARLLRPRLVPTLVGLGLRVLPGTHAVA